MKYLLIFLVIFVKNSFGFDLNKFEKILNAISADEDYLKDFESNLEYLLKLEPNYYDYKPKNFSFDCQLEPSPSRPSSVHQLRPGDIQIVAGLGDSLTASFGSNARTILGLLIEYRGRSWSMGGDSSLNDLITLPNILKQFNSNLRGFSVGNDFSLTTKTGKGFNVAVSGQEANHMPQQARTLIDRFKADKSIDFNNDWKLITLFIGGNDLCDFCKDKNLHSPKAYAGYLQHALDIFYKEVPRAFINLVSVLNVADVKNLNKGLVCTLLHRYGCPCAAFPNSQEEELELVQYIQEYHNYTESLVNSGRYEGRDDFAVVVQPFFTEFKLPRLNDGKVDFSFFAPDCFHFSTKGMTAAAIGLWNNMIQPVGKKSTSSSSDEKILCPSSQSPYLYTNKNSN